MTANPPEQSTPGYEAETNSWMFADLQKRRSNARPRKSNQLLQRVINWTLVHIYACEPALACLPSQSAPRPMTGDPSAVPSARGIAHSGHPQDLI